MRILQILIVYATLVSCQTDIILTGHWHLHPANDGNSYVTNLDFISDTSFIYNDLRPRWEGSLGYLDQKAQTMFWGGECMAGDWSYRKISRNKINIFDRRNKEFLGTLLRKPICSKPDDIFLESRFAIKLPVFQNEITDIGPMSLVRDIMIGPLKHEFLSNYSDKIQVALGDKVVDITNESQFSLYDLQHEVKTPEAKRNQLKVLIYADKNTLPCTLLPVLRHYSGKRQYIYFAGLSSEANNAQLAFKKENVCELIEKLDDSGQ